MNHDVKISGFRIINSIKKGLISENIQSMSKSELTTTTPFQFLGLSEEESQVNDVLRAWRRLSREYHPDKNPHHHDDDKMKALNAAKEQCLDAILKRDYAVTEQEFVRHICKVLEKSLADNCDVHIDLSDDQGLIQPYIRNFFQIRATNAVEWVIRCAIREIQFEQAIEDEIPILCKFYNDFVGSSRWSNNDKTMMMVLNKYEQIKGGGYGGFALSRSLVLEA